MSKTTNQPLTNSCFTTQVIWAQVDVNGHMRHSAYADIAAHARVVALGKAGMDLQKFVEWHIGPVLLKEELMYHREVHLNEVLTVTCELLHTDDTALHWTIRQEIYRSDMVKAATVTVEGTWIDTQKRKKAVLPEEALALFNKIPKAPNFSIRQKPVKP